MVDSHHGKKAVRCEGGSGHMTTAYVHPTTCTNQAQLLGIHHKWAAEQFVKCKENWIFATKLEGVELEEMPIARLDIY